MEKDSRAMCNNLFHVTLDSTCGTILFKTKPICSKRMRRIVSILIFYKLGREHIAYSGGVQILS